MITPIRGRKQALVAGGKFPQILIRNDNPDKGTETKRKSPTTTGSTIKIRNDNPDKGTETLFDTLKYHVYY